MPVTGEPNQDEKTCSRIREVIGVAPSASALETTLQQLEAAGVRRTGISVLGSGTESPRRINTLALLETRSFAGAWAVAAAGGALSAAIGASILGAAPTGWDVLLMGAVAREHADAIRSQFAHGGLVLWVSISDDADEQHAMDVMRRCGSTAVHVHPAPQD